jgi:hypothetical protein
VPLILVLIAVVVIVILSTMGQADQQRLLEHQQRAEQLTQII